MVLFDGMHAELTRFAAADPFRPDVAEQPVGEQPELVRGRGGHRDPAALCAVAGMLQGDRVAPGGQIDVHATGRPRPGLPGLAATVDEFERDAGQGEIAFIAYVTDQHGNVRSGWMRGSAG